MRRLIIIGMLLLFGCSDNSLYDIGDTVYSKRNGDNATIVSKGIFGYKLEFANGNTAWEEDC